ncbi:hypothetical protein [Komagataeibacter rhaeticus]|uniref:Uncharacterized protein n=1 Tax=Komagataeibacter rhaeticus TaxID=215221 RepID=A0A181CB35_9PROT|nr:hypothetical protein [Komagataeibacter rhaeticus]ATU72559.1 hypothetical protein CT154_06630 [Komagataeibacter xylinus]QIP35527.1 hypothetical protein GWK63_08675 [Komagataeibacter rhaeticus]QOC45282.1 hypothetical protein ICJ78_08725 [Komagataeibacter rhaeticus]WPP22312.1 hypothetical protein SCD25_02115 [Komagataeibacter rhaeticus]SAY48770.1 hypothetical protein KRIGEM_01721 [Komagataeibacter rhaeticus]
MLGIRTFDPHSGGNIAYKALTHPLAAERLDVLARQLASAGPVALYDPHGLAGTLLALLPRPITVAGIYTHDSLKVGQDRAGHALRPVVDLRQTTARAIWALDFSQAAMCARLSTSLPPGVVLHTLEPVRLPVAMLSVAHVYLDRLNFATNLAFFRDDAEFSTRLVTANYWARYGARGVRLWLRLFDGDGQVLHTWEQDVPGAGQAIVIDSAEIRQRFSLPAFTGQLFIHAQGIAGHDVVKYALETRGRNANVSLSVTHDANAWPASRYANLPAPAAGEDVVLWVQNSHALPIPAGSMHLNRMGQDALVPIDRELAPYQTMAVHMGDVLPGLAWPEQIEFRAGGYVVRPRYEVTRGGRTRIAHLNVQRADLKPDPHIEKLDPRFFGRGYLLPFPVPDPARYRTLLLPAPMAESLSTLPVRVDCFDAEGRGTGSHFPGCLARDHATMVDVGALARQAGHAELLYDFREGGTADGWLHALIRYEDRESGHVAESSFGSHIFNTVMTYRGEPQSYAGSPPGLSTRLFLTAACEEPYSFCWLIYPASGIWHAVSDTSLHLHAASGEVIACEKIAIPMSGSRLVRPDHIFGAQALRRAGVGGYVIIRDTTCRLFGYHGRHDDGAGRFSLDHMFGF